MINILKRTVVQLFMINIVKCTVVQPHLVGGQSGRVMDSHTNQVFM